MTGSGPSAAGSGATLAASTVLATCSGVRWAGVAAGGHGGSLMRRATEAAARRSAVADCVPKYLGSCPPLATSGDSWGIGQCHLAVRAGMGRLHRHVSGRQWPARASKTRVRQRRHEGSLREVRGGTSVGAAPGTPSTVMVPGVSGGGTCYGAYGMLWAKAFAYIAGSDDGGVLGCRFPRWGRHLGSPSLRHGFSR